MANPTLAFRRCEDCRTYVYDGDGRRIERGGVEVKRSPTDPPPYCRKCPKLDGIEEKTPAAGEKYGSLSAKNWLALRLYFQRRAGVQTPLDSVAAKNVGLIEQVIFYHQAHTERLQIELLKMKAKP